MVDADIGSDASEAELVRAIAGGDKRAFEQLFRQHGERIFRYVVRMIGDAGKAEEVGRLGDGKLKG